MLEENDEGEVTELGDSNSSAPQHKKRSESKVEAVIERLIRDQQRRKLIKK